MPLSSDTQTQFSVGDLVRIEVDWNDLDATAVDPTEITLQVEDPTSTTTTYTYGLGQVSRDAVGSYYYDLALDQPGKYTARWAATGAAVGSESWTFSVIADPFA